MKKILWPLQIFLAIHTYVGALWKFGNSEQMVPSLQAIPHGLWMSLIAVEFLASAALLLPIVRPRFSHLATFAAGLIAIEMLFFTVVHVLSGDSAYGQVVYWLVIAIMSGLLAYGRFESRRREAAFA